MIRKTNGRRPMRVGILHARALMREALSAMLESWGVVVIAPPPAHVPFLDHLERDGPDVVLLDLDTPAASIPVLAELRARLPDLPRLVLSEGSDPEWVAAWLEAGADAYLDKVTGDGRAVIRAVRALAASEESEIPPVTQGETLLDRLTAREAEVLIHLAAGARNKPIASVLGICERTVKAHVSSLYRKLGQENRTQLALLAMQLHMPRLRA